MLYLKRTPEEKAYFRDQVFYLCRQTRLMDTRAYYHHLGTSVLRHSINVAYLSYALALILHIRIHDQELIRGALLHDYYLYDCHEKGNPDKRFHIFRHPGKALYNSEEEMMLSKREADIIRKHMFPMTPVPPRYRESFLVSISDKCCALYELTTNIYRIARRKL
ncbi:MAG: HD domain-containing protein [Spirochaetia bacterium]|nr:HD domain-containing protein [Spirochaetia bacterium]